MNCPHCMQDSSPQGKHMDAAVFQQVYDFCYHAMPMVVSITGGEPTEHPTWINYAKTLLTLPSIKILTILTNGAWIEDSHQRIAMAKLIRQYKDKVKVQVYSHPKYYRNHEWTVGHEAQFRSIGCQPDFASPIYMQDLGRARKNCSEEVEDSVFVPSCINSHLIAVQAPTMLNFISMATAAGKFCRPLIDPDGNIHMSESRLCPSVAHVSDGVTLAYQKMRQSRPCKGCRLYRNFVQLHPKESELLK